MGGASMLRSATRCFAGAVTVAATLVAAAPAPADNGRGTAAHVWVTTPDGAMKMADQGTVPFRPGGSSRLTITVDPSRGYQRMDGFGASITDSSAVVPQRLSPAQPEGGVRPPFCRGGGRLLFFRPPQGAPPFPP